MKKYILFLFLLSFLRSYSSVPDFKVNPDPYAYTMNVTGVVNFYGDESVDENDIVAAFVGDECRGFAQPKYLSVTDRWTVFLSVYGNESGEEISFQLYDASIDSLYELDKKMVFTVNELLGEADLPYVWSYPTLSNSSEILSFSVATEEKTAIITEDSVKLFLPYGTDVKHLIVEFETAAGAKVDVDGQVQESGISENDFSSPVIYSISSPDLTAFKEYTVVVYFGNATPSDIAISDSLFVETTEIGKLLITFSTIDIDVKDTHIYSFIEGSGDDDNSKFTIVDNQLFVADTLDFETKDSLSIRVMTDDGNGGIFEKQFNIYLQNINDEKPIIHIDTVYISESHVLGEPFYTISVTDPDGDTAFEYFITDGNTGNHFAISQLTGDLLLLSNLDYEHTTEYNLEIVVNDGVNQNTGILPIMVENENDEMPILISTIFSIAEDAELGAVVDTLKSTDPDGETEFTYTLISGNEGDVFALDSKTGELTIQGKLNYETIPVYNLEIEVGDGVQSKVYELAIQISETNDETPIAENTTFEVFETALISTIAGTVQATDPDKGTLLSYEITAGNDEHTFDIGLHTGIIAINKNLDYDSIPAYILNIAVSDGIFADTATIHINLIDENDEHPDVLEDTIHISELNELGIPFYTIGVDDRDADSKFTFTLFNGNIGNSFGINNFTGQLYLLNQLDYEDIEEYKLTILVDDGKFTNKGIITVLVDNENDELPVTVSANVHLDENSTEGWEVYQVVASDPDSLVALQYDIIKGNQNETFTIDSATGLITLAGSADYEDISIYNLIVSVSDSVEVINTDINIFIDNVFETPVINDTVFSLDENSMFGSFVGQIPVFDPDSIHNHYFEIVEGNLKGMFEIGVNDGIVSLLNEGVCDYETDSVWKLVVKVTDLDNIDLIDQATVTINLNDINEYPSLADTSFTISEDIEEKKLIGTIPFSDEDLQQIHIYTIISGNEDSVFVIDSLTGDVSVKSTELLDYESIDEYELLIQISDNGVPSLSAECIVTVSVEDKMDEEIDAANYMSPNGDGVNDNWLIRSPELYSGCTFTIYDEQSNKVFNQTGYENDFDGTKNGKQLSTGTYYYTVECKDEGYIYNGSFTLQR